MIEPASERVLGWLEAEGIHLNGQPEQLAGDGGSWAPHDLVALAQRRQPARPPAILRTPDGRALLYRGARHLISGPPESLKSWLALAAAAEVIGAGEDVVWIDSDRMGPHALLERLHALGLDDAAISRHVVYVEPEGRPGEELTTLVERRPALVVLDAVTGAISLLGLKSSSSDDFELLMRSVVNPFHTAGAATVLIDHVVKDQEARAGWAYGSERKVGAVDVHLQPTVMGEALSRTSGASVHLAAPKDRPGWHERHGPARMVGTLDFTPSDEGAVMGWSLSLGPIRVRPDDERPFRPTRLMERVSRFIETSSGPVSQRSIRDGVSGKREYVLGALGVLISEGYVVVEEGPNQAQLHRSAKPYRDEEVAA